MHTGHIRTQPELLALIERAVKSVEAMTPQEKADMTRTQRDGWVRAEMSWPRDCPYR